MKNLFKQLLSKLAGETVPPEQAKVIRAIVDDEKEMESKSSRIWGADDEFNYGRFRELVSPSGIPQPRGMGTYENYVRQYGHNVWVYAAVYQIAVSIAAVPWNLYKRYKYKKDKDERKVEDNPKHPLVKLLTKPNPFMSSYDLKEAIVASLELTGNAYLEQVFDPTTIVEIYPLQSHKIEIIPDEKKLIAGYLYKTGSRVVKFGADELIHLRYYNPTSDFYGMSAMSPSEMSVSTDNYAKEWNRNFFKNSAIPSSILETDQVLNENVAKRIVNRFLSLHRGTKRATALLEGGVKWRDITTTRKDMEFSILQKMTRDEILASLGVYAPLIGISENVNNSVLDNIKKLFWENTLLPKMEKIEAALNAHLIWPIDDSVVLTFDRDSIEGLKGSQETRARLASMLVDRGIMTQNEARSRYFNLPNVIWGDQWYMPLNLIPVDKAGQGMGTGTGGEGDRIPGRQIGRPAVDQGNIRKVIEVLNGILENGSPQKIEEIQGDTVDSSTRTMLPYGEDGNGEKLENEE